MISFAHSLSGEPETDWEPLSVHLVRVGGLSAEFARPFGAENISRTMGLLHDIGKASAAYQSYIRRPHEQGGPKGPDHSSAGAKEAVKLYGPQYGRLMAYALAGHHAGLMDGRKLDERLGKAIEDYAGWEAHAPDLSGLDGIRPDTLPQKNSIEPLFSLPFLARMLFSALVDADFLATEAFYAEARQEPSPTRGGALTHVHRATVQAFLARPHGDTPVNRLRAHILAHANGKAALPPGLFTLSVPTGGGKTLTSLSFAMDHAFTHGLRRIVYVIPFTSIIEQTAKVFREDVGLGDAVLEHHASFDWDQQRPGTDGDSEGEGAAGLAKLRRDAENWDAPVIVTTAVQFFESLFAARTSKSRKLHNLAKSVIILDEAQMMPVHLLRPCMAAIDELAKNYGATVILCTATQPALRAIDEALPADASGRVAAFDIGEDRELAPDPQGLYAQLKRAEVEWRQEPISDAALAARFADQPQMLCIVNSRAHARALFEAIRGQEGAAHLTTLMCARHRRVVLERLRADLATGKPVRLVATSLVEAGVDISFPEVWRAEAGLSNIVQAAGRCNRNGEMGPLGQAFGRTVLFTPADRKTPRAIAAFYQPAKNVLRREGVDIMGLEAVRDYYRWLYWEQGHQALDAAQLDGAAFPIVDHIRDTARALATPFESIARAFRMIDDLMEPVIIPWDDAAREAINTLRHAERPPAAVLRLLQQYTVSVPPKTRAALLGRGLEVIRTDQYGDRFVVMVEDRAGELPSLYDPAVGMLLEHPEMSYFF